jgi:hypothetical protein
LFNSRSNYTIGTLNLADLLTWGAFTYPGGVPGHRSCQSPLRSGHGPNLVVFIGFVIAVALSVWLASRTRIAIASGSAF